MESYYVTVDYRTPGGSPATWTGLVDASDPTGACEIAMRRLNRRARPPSKIDGGSAYAPLLRLPAHK